MAMLAEPRQRKRYNLVPKGKALFEDGDRYGTKMLEKMGWSKGKGLGRHENGQQEFIRVRYKNDANGLGFEDRDDQWTEHEKHFNGLLENLNGGESNTNSASDDGDAIAAPTVGLGFQPKSSSKLKDKFSGQSLEEKSKNSKARVHYKKFTKGKDMAQYSEKDLANIFGKKATPEDVNIYTQFQSFGVIPRDENEKEKEESVKKTPLESGTQIINTGVSVSDYFKQKMAALKQKKGGTVENEHEAAENDKDEVSSVQEKSCEKRSTEVDVAEAPNHEEEAPRKKKKNKKQPTSSEENGPIEQENDDQLGMSVVQDVSSKKKKSKKAVDSVESEASKQLTETEIIDLEVQESTSSKKKKNKKHAISDEDNITEQVSTVELQADALEKCSDSIPLEDVPSKKKKRKNKDVLSEEGGYVEPTRIDNSVVEENVSSKKKKKNKKQENSMENISVPSSFEPAQTELTGSNATDIHDTLVKKKKSKKEPVIVIDSDMEEDLKKQECTEKKSIESLEKVENKSPSLEKTADEIPSKKKKSKKRPAEELESTECAIESSPIPKKKKKSKKPTTEDSPSVQETREYEATSEDASEEDPKKRIKKTDSTIPTPVIKVSPHHELNHLKDNCLLEKFRNIEMHQFTASNISQFSGYGLSEDLELKIKPIKNDEERIVRLWSGTLDKYQFRTPKHKIYCHYMTKVKNARTGKTKIPRMKVKCLKRKNIFECL